MQSKGDNTGKIGMSVSKSGTQMPVLPMACKQLLFLSAWKQNAFADGT
jgi:hypothetical protein